MFGLPIGCLFLKNSHLKQSNQIFSTCNQKNLLLEVFGMIIIIPIGRDKLTNFLRYVS